MRKRIITIACIAIVAVLMALVGSAILPSDPHPSPTAKITPVTDGVAIYEQAIASFRDSGNATMEIKSVQQLVTNNDILTEQAQQSLSYQGYNTETVVSAYNELITIGKHNVEISEAYADGAAYVTIAQSNFRADYSAQEYQKRLIPAALFDAALYENIIAFDSGNEYILYFKQPSGIETWAIKDGWEFSDAQGFALADHDGNLLKSAYSVTYKYVGTNNINDILHLTVYADHLPAGEGPKVPSDPSAYTKISYLDGPRMLEKASAYLLRADNISAQYHDRVFCQAFGDERTKAISLYTINSDEFSARVDTETLLTNTGHVGDTTQHTHNELFANGVYTIRVDGENPTQNTSITAESIQNYCQNQLVSTIMLPGDIGDTHVTETENTLEIHFIPKTEFASVVSSNACQTLYQKPELLNELAESNQTQILEAYLVLNKHNGLPLSSGVEYDSLYTIEGVPYQLQYKANQSYDIAGTDAQLKINEAAGH